MARYIIPSLLCLLTCIPSGMLLTEIQLARVTEYVKDEISSGHLNFEHAYAVKFTSSECRQLSNNDITRALSQENIDLLRETVRDFGIYRGVRMVAASYSDTRPRMHAEYRLLHGEGGFVSPFENLLNMEPAAGCVVFFSLYSPCLSRCVDIEHHWNIVQYFSILDRFRVSRDNRAFVFRNVYYDDQKRGDDEIWAGWRELNKKMTLFRCKNDCHRCFITPAGGGESIAVRECLH